MTAERGSPDRLTVSQFLVRIADALEEWPRLGPRDSPGTAISTTTPSGALAYIVRDQVPVPARVAVIQAMPVITTDDFAKAAALLRDAARQQQHSVARNPAQPVPPTDGPTCGQCGHPIALGEPMVDACGDAPVVHVRCWRMPGGAAGDRRDDRDRRGSELERLRRPDPD